ncbi:MAG: hypothetical protein IT537_10715 [Hyphomicrobiales bacterium]|nr:hypothetical protein [Hyphomicrobiales bacterium]
MTHPLDQDDFAGRLRETASFIVLKPINVGWSEKPLGESSERLEAMPRGARTFGSHVRWKVHHGQSLHRSDDRIVLLRAPAEL